jgi:hypothetical protein
MQFRRYLGLVALIAVSCSVGCSMTNPTVRAQAPETPGPIVGTAPGYGEFKRAPYLGRHGHDFRVYSQFRDNNLGFEGGYYARPEPYISEANMPYTYNAGCPDCNYGQSCPTGGCPRCGCGCGHGCFPHHYQTYQFDWPRNLVYPQQGVQSGMVQYPYYTLRGPTDFFMK